MAQNSFPVELLGAGEGTVLDLQEWLRSEKIAGLIVTPKTNPPAKGEMGAELAEILSIVLGSGSVIALVQSIRAWIDTRKPRGVLEFKKPGLEFKVDLTDTAKIDETFRKAIEAAKKMGGG